MVQICISSELSQKWTGLGGFASLLRTLHKQPDRMGQGSRNELSGAVRCNVYHPMISRSTKNKWIFNHISRSTICRWLFNTLAISPSKPNINTYSIVKITIDQCCSNVVAININNIRFHWYGNGDSTFILHWNFNINHNDDSDGKSIFIKCWLAVWGGGVSGIHAWPVLIHFQRLTVEEGPFQNLIEVCLKWQVGFSVHLQLLLQLYVLISYSVHLEKT